MGLGESNSMNTRLPSGTSPFRIAFSNRKWVCGGKVEGDPKLKDLVLRPFASMMLSNTDGATCLYVLLDPKKYTLGYGMVDRSSGTLLCHHGFPQ
jgi:hypothetical protein